MHAHLTCPLCLLTLVGIESCVLPSAFQFSPPEAEWLWLKYPRGNDDESEMSWQQSVLLTQKQHHLLLYSDSALSPPVWHSLRSKSVNEGKSFFLFTSQRTNNCSSCWLRVWEYVNHIYICHDNINYSGQDHLLSIEREFSEQKKCCSGPCEPSTS